MSSPPRPPRDYVAFLRAINVGGRNVKMDHLRSLFEALGLQRAETFIASGNVAFRTSDDPAALEERIEHHLHQALGYPVATFVRDLDAVAAAAACRPFPGLGPDAGGHTLSVAFLKSPPDETAQRALLEHRSDVDDFRVVGREAYWLCRTRVSESRFSGAVLERAIRMPATIRNVTTVRRLAARYPAARP